MSSTTRVGFGSGGCGTGGGIWGSGAGPVLREGLGGTLLGPENSGASCPMAVVAVFFVVVWLLDSGREHLCSCFAQID